MYYNSAGKIIYGKKDKKFIKAFADWLDSMSFPEDTEERVVLMLVVMKYVLNKRESKRHGLENVLANRHNTKLLAS